MDGDVLPEGTKLSMEDVTEAEALKQLRYHANEARQAAARLPKNRFSRDLLGRARELHLLAELSPVVDAAANGD